MTEKEVEKAIKIKKELDYLEECVNFFIPGSGEFASETDRETAIRRIKRGCKLLLSGFGNKLYLNSPGFCGGKSISVDMEFVNYCRKYFEKKLEDKKKELEKI